MTEPLEQQLQHIRAQVLRLRHHLSELKQQERTEWTLGQYKHKFHDEDNLKYIQQKIKETERLLDATYLEEAMLLNSKPSC